MPLILIALLLFVVLAFTGVVVLSLALRYRAGTARRQGRRWAVTVNLWLTAFSAITFLLFTGAASFWLGPSLRFALVGMAVGGLLGLLGLALTVWESEAKGLFYTPSRWLALLITLVITGRFAYGWWRITHPRLTDTPAAQHWVIAANGTQLSIAVAGGLIAYYLAYAIGVRWRITRHERRR